LRQLYRLLYGRLVYFYDPLSSWISMGEWERWQKISLTDVIGPRVLDLACGTGTLLTRLPDFVKQPLGIDISPQMLAIAKEKGTRTNRRADLIRASATSLPIKSTTLSSILITFPPRDLINPESIREIYRVLEPSGHLVIIDNGLLKSRSVTARIRNALLVNVREDCGLKRIRQMFQDAGFDTTLIHKHIDISSVWIVFGRKVL
jgi:ubiquinone/menaquinone biosynthesis C-methylase UbiE